MKKPILAVAATAIAASATIYSCTQSEAKKRVGIDLANYDCELS